MNNNIYSFDDIKSHVHISQYLRDHGFVVKNGRFVAKWRGGENDSCAIDKDDMQWYDHVAKEGGTILDLALKIENFPSIFIASQALGERYHLQPKNTIRYVAPENGEANLNRYQELVRDGYSLVAKYAYVDEFGKELYSVLRMENKNAGKKTFLQRTPDHWGLEGIRRVLYNLPNVIKSETVFIVEGEKDADTLNSLGFCATTNNGGAKNWESDFTRFFAGKHVIIVADNDDAGKEHAQLVHREINDVVQSIKIGSPSTLEKGDVTDYLTKEGGTKESFLAWVAALPFKNRKEHSARNENDAVATARELNQTPFSNFRIVSELDKKGKVKEVEKPIDTNSLLLECRARFLDFPKKLNQVLFDRDRKTNEIRFIHSADALFAWIARKSRHNVEWSNARGCVSQAQFFQALTQDAASYEGIAKAPHFPTRPEIFYIHKPLPRLDQDAPSQLDIFLSFFAPANETYRVLIKALIMAPMFFGSNAPRPAWVIDSVDGKGVGKTTLVKLLAELYEEAPIDLDGQSVKNDFTSLVKRLISSEGRSRRIALLDNVQGTFRSQNLARLITMQTVSGVAPYGRGEETRVNDLTYIITSNAASLDDDIAQRCYTIKLKRAVRAASWEARVRKFIALNRETLFAEIFSLLQSPKVKIENPVTRYPEFEVSVLGGACSSYEEYEAVVASLVSDYDGSNVTAERAIEIVDVFRDAIDATLRLVIGGKINNPCFLTTAAVSHIIAGSEVLRLEGVRKSEIMEMIQSGNISAFSKNTKVIFFGGRSYRGLLWKGSDVKLSSSNYVSLITVEKDSLVAKAPELHYFRNED